MTKNIQTEKLNAAIDMLIESDADLSSVLGKEGLIKQLSKRILEVSVRGTFQLPTSHFHSHIVNKTTNNLDKLVIVTVQKNKN